MGQKVEWEEIDRLLEEIAEGQRRKLLAFGRRIIPQLTSDDVLQPNDFPLLDHHPEFRYEEGMLAGLQAAQIAIRANLRTR